MNLLELESQLSQFETQLALLSAAMLHNDLHAITVATTGLQPLVAALAEVLHAVPVDLNSNQALQLRINKIVHLFHATSDGLARQRAGVDGALSTLFPASQSTTYTAKMGVLVRQPYASAGRQSGEFKAIAA